MRYSDHYEEAGSEEITDGFPITVELVFKKNIEDLEKMDFYEIVRPPFAELNVIADGKVVDTDEPLSMINKYNLFSNNYMHLH
ncbi:MAG: hypothetical protein PV340_03150 [Wolbachia sp.]|nr:hypothetical protein [Wolbachia sp.]MDD9336662.1 hypothetical protein [Wolbachia sp.]